MTEVVVRTDGLRKEYGRAGLHGVDLRVERGTVYGLVGANGAGKTTLLSLLSGLRRPDAGRIEIGVARARIAVCPDVPEFEPWLTAREVVELAGRLVAGDGGLPGGAVEDALAVAGLGDEARRRVGGFSRGMTQRLAIAATIVGDPELVILDEPSSALDPSGRHEVLDLVARLGRRATVLFSSHILDDVQRVADHVGVLADGRLLYQGPLDQLLERHTRPAWTVRLHGDAGPVATALAGQDWVSSADAVGPAEVRVEGRSLEEGERRLPAALGALGVRVSSIEPMSADLESVFLRLVGDGRAA